LEEGGAPIDEIPDEHARRFAFSDQRSERSVSQSPTLFTASMMSAPEGEMRRREIGLCLAHFEFQIWGNLIFGTLD